jgi:hypothetical protein
VLSPAWQGYCCFFFHAMVFKKALKTCPGTICAHSRTIGREVPALGQGEAMATTVVLADWAPVTCQAPLWVLMLIIAMFSNPSSKGNEGHVCQALEPKGSTRPGNLSLYHPVMVTIYSQALICFPFTGWCPARAGNTLKMPWLPEQVCTFLR